MAKHLLENVRAANPAARCGLVVASRGAMIKDLLQAYPWIEVVEVNRRTPVKLLRFLRDYWGSDMVVTLYTGGLVKGSTKLVARIIAKRGGLIGYKDRSSLNGWVYDVLLPLPPDRSRAPRLLEEDALNAAGVPISLDAVSLRYVPQPGLLERLNLTKGNYIVVGFFSGAEARGLSPSRRQELLDALAREFPTMTLVLTGTAKEREAIARMHLPPKAVVAQTTVQELAALIDEAACTTSVGTGTSHIASHLRRPLVVIAACQGLQWVGKDQYGDAPVTVFCKPEECVGGHDYSSYATCMNEIDMSAVVAATRAFMPHSA